MLDSAQKAIFFLSIDQLWNADVHIYWVFLAQLGQLKVFLRSMTPGQPNLDISSLILHSLGDPTLYQVYNQN